MGKSEDDEIDEGLINFIAEMIKEDQECEYEKVDSKIEIVEKIYEVTKKMFKGAADSKLSFNEPFKGMGVITLTGKKIYCLMPDYFATISKAASNINIYAMANGSVQIDFTFYGCEEKRGN